MDDSKNHISYAEMVSRLPCYAPSIELADTERFRSYPQPQWPVVKDLHPISNNAQFRGSETNRDVYDPKTFSADLWALTPFQNNKAIIPVAQHLSALSEIPARPFDTLEVDNVIVHDVQGAAVCRYVDQLPRDLLKDISGVYAAYLHPEQTAIDWRITRKCPNTSIYWEHTLSAPHSLLDSGHRPRIVEPIMQYLEKCMREVVERMHKKKELYAFLSLSYRAESREGRFWRMSAKAKSSENTELRVSFLKPDREYADLRKVFDIAETGFGHVRGLPYRKTAHEYDVVPIAARYRAEAGALVMPGLEQHGVLMREIGGKDQFSADISLFDHVWDGVSAGYRICNNPFEGLHQS